MMHSSKSVLIVDDSIFMRVTLAEMLKKERLDYQIYEAQDGVEAVQLYKKLRPNLVAMDLNMPKASGMQALRAIKKIESNAKVILITANKERDAQNEAFANQVHGFVTKPVDREAFVWMVKDALKE